LNFNDATEQLPDPADMILFSCYEVGLKAGRNIAPLWKDDIRRIYFTGSNKLLARGASCARNDMWRDAAAYWRQAADSKNERISAKAAYNMALVCEIEDKLELAYNWIAMSDSIRSTEFSILYQQIIQNRLKHRTMLDEQMGFQE
jgi:hypothetical protein